MSPFKFFSTAICFLSFTAAAQTPMPTAPAARPATNPPANLPRTGAPTVPGAVTGTVSTPTKAPTPPREGADPSAAQETVRRVYAKTPTGYLMVLRQGENVLDQLNTLMASENIPSATISGQGMVNVKFGYFDAKTKKYNPKDFKNVELASLSGSLAWQNRKPSVHAHGVVSGKDFIAYGGHILELSVGTGSVEITVIVHENRLERRFDEKLGANVLEL